MTIFIIPIVIILVPIMQSIGQGQAMPTEASTILIAITFLLPASVMAMSLGSFMIGEEGQTVWRIYASPISAKSLVKSKYVFIIFFSLMTLAITGSIGFIVYHPSLRTTVVACFEAFFLVFALGTISLSNGISGADFTETPRPRMIRQSSSLVNLGACLLSGIAILAPFTPYLLSSTLAVFAPTFFGGLFLDPFLALVVSAVIALVLAVIFYRIALSNAMKLLTKAEM
jgi:hypothetical protein